MALTVQTRCLMSLGYSLVTIQTNPSIFPPSIGVDGLAFAQGILDRLDILDSELTLNIKDSMAVKVQDLGLDYARYTIQALAMGSRLLNELSIALSTPILHNKYTSGTSKISVRNYY